ncbi:MAG: hypothetical protein R2779_06180 [Crocinitomicaceae bacterium]
MLQLDLTNAFPFGKIKLLFVDENGAVIETVNASQPIVSSLYGEQNSNGLWHKTSTVEVPLSIVAVDKLNLNQNIVVEAILIRQIPTSSNQMVGIPVNAYLGIKKARTKNSVKNEKFSFFVNYFLILLIRTCTNVEFLLLSLILPTTILNQ